MDVGTNTVLLTIVEVLSDGAVAILLERATVTRLGYQVDQTRKLNDEAVKRTLGCFKEYQTQLEDFGVTDLRVVGTSALRDAQGGERFLEQAEKVFRVPLEVIDGTREAALTFRGSLNGLDLSGTVLVFDIGGGSTELILGEASGEQIHYSKSMDLGSVRLSERFQLSDPPEPEQLQALRKLVKKELSGLAMTVPEQCKVIGVAGTVTTLCALASKVPANNPALLHGKILRTADVSNLVENLSQLTVEQRLALPGMTAGRADVIVAGSILCEELLLFSRADELYVSDRGVRFGLLAE